MTAEGTFPKVNGDILYAKDVNALGRVLVSNQEAAVTGTVGTETKNVTIDANIVVNGVLIIWHFQCAGGSAGGAGTQGGTITSELAIGPTGAEVIKVSGLVQSRVTNIANPHHYWNSPTTLMWYESGLDWTEENKVIVGYSAAANAYITNVSLQVIAL